MARPLPCGDGEQGQIENEYAGDGRDEVVEEFHGFTGVCRDEVEEHIDGYHASSEEIDEHHLEGGEEDYGEENPHCPPRLAGERHGEGVGTQRQKYAGEARKERHTLGEAERDVWHEKCRHAVGVKETGGGYGIFHY